jgi:hypothetical protein
MVRLLTCLAPLIVLLVFKEHQTKFILPTIANIFGLSILFLSTAETRSWKGTQWMMLFVNSILGIVWLLSEKAEARAIAPFAIPIQVGLAAAATAVILASQILEPKYSHGIIGFCLIFAVGYLSTGTGSGSRMFELFQSYGLNETDAWAWTVRVRKTIHCLFYASVSWFFFRHFFSFQVKLGISILLGWLVTLCVAINDEFRQSMVPDRTGTIADVFLDMSAATLLLAFCFFLHRKTQNSKPTPT